MRRGTREPLAPDAATARPGPPPPSAISARLAPLVRRAPTTPTGPGTTTPEAARRDHRGPWLASLTWFVRSYRTYGALLFVVLCVALLATGGASARIADPTATDPSIDPPAPATVEPTATPWPTPTPAPPPPLFVPTDWQVYRAHHLALAFPAGWVVNEYVARDYEGPGVSTSISFATPDGTLVIGIDEHESLDPATLEAYCAQPGTRTTYAGLPMISARTGTRVRMFVFVTTGGSGGIAYTLLYTEVGTPDQIKWLYDSIFATFRPEYQTPACA